MPFKTKSAWAGNVDFETSELLTMNADAISVDQLVYVTNGQAELADATDLTKPAMGICVKKNSPTEIRVVFTGGLIKTGLSLIDNTHYYLSTTPGALSQVIPSGAGNRRQYIGRAVNIGADSYINMVPYYNDLLDSGRTRYSHSFSNLSTVIVPHNLGVKPLIQTFDNLGVVIEESGITSITHDSDNQCTIVFDSSKTGTVLCIAGSDINRPLDVNHVGITKFGDGGTTNYIEIDSSGRTEYRGEAAPNLERYTCTASEAKGNIVYISSNGNVRNANASDDTKSPAIGFVAYKIDNTTCLVQRNGVIRGFSGLTPGALIFLDVIDGAITEDPPNNIGNTLQIVGRAKSTTEIELEIDVDAYSIVESSDNRAVRWNPNSKAIELAPTAFSGISSSIVAYLDTFNTTINTYLLGSEKAPYLEPRGLGFKLNRMSVSFRTTSPSSCSLDIRAYIRRLVGGTWTNSEVFKIDWESNDIAADARFDLSTEVDRSGLGTIIASVGQVQSKVSNPRDDANEGSVRIDSISDRVYQTFLIPINDAIIVEKITLRCGYIGSLSNAALKCHLSSLESNGAGPKPKSSTTNTFLTLDIGSAEYPASSMTPGGGDAVFDFSENKIYLEANTSAAIVIEAIANGETIDASNAFDIFITTDSAYANGSMGTSSNSGSTWTANDSTEDLVFNIEGKTAEGLMVKIIGAGTDKVDQLSIRLDTELT